MYFVGRVRLFPDLEHSRIRRKLARPIKKLRRILFPLSCIEKGEDEKKENEGLTGIFLALVCRWEKK